MSQKNKYTSPPKFEGENFDRKAVKVTQIPTTQSSQFGSGTKYKPPEINPDTDKPYYTPPWTPD